MHWKAMQCDGKQCNAMGSNAMQWNVMQYSGMQCNTVECDAVECNVMQCYAIKCKARQGNGMISQGGGKSQKTIPSLSWTVHRYIWISYKFHNWSLCFRIRLNWIQGKCSPMGILCYYSCPSHVQGIVLAASDLRAEVPHLGEWRGSSMLTMRDCSMSRSWQDHSRSCGDVSE